MALPRPNNDPNQPIPNQPFYAPLNPYVNGPYFPVDLGPGMDMTSSATVPSLVNDVAGVLIAGDGISISTIGTDSTVTNIGVTSLVAGPNITLSASSGVVTISAAGGPSGSVTSVGTGVGLTGGPITTSGTISLATSGVSAGSYTNPNITVDAYGRITVATSGTASLTGLTGTVPVVITGSSPTLNVAVNAASTTAPGVVQLNNTTSSTSTTQAATANAVKTAYDAALASVQSVTGTTPIAVTAGTAPVVSIAAASTTAAGAVQLNDTTSSTSTTLALTANQGKNLQDQINALAVTSNITLAGTIDGSTGNLVTVTTEGTAAGFTVGSPLPAATAGNAEYFVIVTVAGTMTPPGGTATVTHVGDWFLSNGTAWQFLDVGPAIPAASTTTAGIVELATDAETQTGTDATRAVTPAGAAATYIACSAYTAKGAILGATGVSAPVALPVGTDGQILYANSACSTGLCWGLRPITQNDFDAKGDLLAGLGADSFTNLAVGTNGQILYACSTAASGLCWAAAPAGASQATPTALGTLKGKLTTNDTGLGCNVLLCNTGGNNVAVGLSALQCLGSTFSGFMSQNTAIGTCALRNATEGQGNVGIGFCSGATLGCGTQNVFIGCKSGLGAITGTYNIAIGTGARFASDVSSCLVIGNQDDFGSCYYWLTGNSSLAIKPGAGIIDCAGSCGTAGQVLMSNGSNAICWGALPASGIPCACITGKGALVTGTAASTPSALAVGTDGQILYACSTATNGLCWDAAPSGATPATPTVAGTVTGCVDDVNFNTSVGCNALLAVTPSGISGSNNVAIGINAACSLTTGFGNIAIGPYASCAGTAVGSTIAIGCCALKNNTFGNNLAIGNRAMLCPSTSTYNIAIGNDSRFLSTAGDNNISIGLRSMRQSTGDYSVAIGTDALCKTTGSYNIAIGAAAGQNITSGTNNLIFGFGGGGFLTTGSCNVFIGASPNANVSCCLAIGVDTLFWLTGGSTGAIKPAAGVVDCANSCGTAGQILYSQGNAICWGAAPSGASPATPTSEGVVFALTDNATTFNTALGGAALNSSSTGSGNLALGYCSGNALTSGSANTYVGSAAGCSSLDGNVNVGVGFQALSGITTGSTNMAIGAFAGNALTTESHNAIIGGHGGLVGVDNHLILSDGQGSLRAVINNCGALSPDNISYGTAGQVLQSNGAGSPFSWASPAPGYNGYQGYTSTTSGTKFNVTGYQGELGINFIGQLNIFTTYDGGYQVPGSNALIFLNGFNGVGTSTVQALNTSTGIFAVESVLYPAYTDITVTFTPSISTTRMNFYIRFLDAIGNGGPYNGSFFSPYLTLF